MTGLQILAEEVGVSDRTLRRAVNQGTIRAQRPTPRRLEISAAEKQYVRRSWSLLSMLRSALRSEPNVRFALLFGSAARGDDGPGSDVDLIIEMRDPSFDRIIELGTRLEAVVDRKVDLVAIEQATANPTVLADAVSEGRVLVDRENRWTELRRRERAIERRARSWEKRRSADALAGIDRLLTL